MLLVWPYAGCKLIASVLTLHSFQIVFFLLDPKLSKFFAFLFTLHYLQTISFSFNDKLSPNWLFLIWTYTVSKLFASHFTLHYLQFFYLSSDTTHLQIVSFSFALYCLQTNRFFFELTLFQDCFSFYTLPPNWLLHFWA